MTAERQWIFPIDSKADVVMPNGVHVYWSTHCRHGNHADCKGSCKTCGSPCLCAGCRHQIPLPVEGSTPLDSPAPRSCVETGPFGPCVLAADDHEPSHGWLSEEEQRRDKSIAQQHRDEYGNEWWTRDPGPPDMRSRRQGGRGPLATGGIITDPPILLADEDGCALTVPARADQPAALLKLIDEFGDARYDVGLLVGGPSEAADEAEAVAVRLAATINAAVNALWAAGVEEGRRAQLAELEPAPPKPGNPAYADEYEQGIYDEGIREGRRQRDAEIRADVLASARAVAVEAGFGPAPESVTVSYETSPSPFQRGIYDAGVAEGRRQATEEVERLQVLLDHAEQYARDLQDNGDAEAERDEEWGLRYKVDGLQREAGDGGHVFDSRAEAEQHITAWKRTYPELTYADVEYMSREVLTNPWVPRG